MIKTQLKFEGKRSSKVVAINSLSVKANFHMGIYKFVGQFDLESQGQGHKSLEKSFK